MLVVDKLFRNTDAGLGLGRGTGRLVREGGAGTGEGQLPDSLRVTCRGCLCTSGAWSQPSVEEGGHLPTHPVSPTRKDNYRQHPS